jgi:hypothetical protein
MSVATNESVWDAADTEKGVARVAQIGVLVGRGWAGCMFFTHSRVCKVTGERSVRVVREANKCGVCAGILCRGCGMVIAM